MAAVFTGHFYVTLDDVKYVHGKGVLYHRRELGVDEDPKKFLSHCGDPVTELELVKQFHAAMTARNETRFAARIAKRAQAIAEKEREMSGFVDSMLNMVSRKHVAFTDRYEKAILDAAAELKTFHFKNLYASVCLRLGATDEQASKGLCPNPYKPEQIKDIRGFVRSWVEERSPHSRQHYFRAGKRTAWLPGERPLLFVNARLFQENTQHAWAPYTHVRGDVWSYDPEAAQASPRPDEAILHAAETLYRKRGMQGRREVLGETAVITRQAHVPGILWTVGASAAVAVAIHAH